MKYIKVLMLTVVITMLFAFPVFAQEVTNPNEVIKEETFNAGEDILIKEFHNSQVWRSDNYLKYLNDVIYNMNEIVRIKKEIVDNYKWLSQYNPYYATLIPAAEKDLAEAQAWVDYYKAYKIQVENDFKVKYPR